MARRRTLSLSDVGEVEGHHGRTLAHSREEEDDRPPRDPRVFADNLRRLTLMAGLSWGTAAERVGASHVWYRRAVTKGLCRVPAGTRPVLERVAVVFRLARVSDLWRPGLVAFGPATEAAASPGPAVRDERWRPCVRKLTEVLASGRYPWVVELIDSLYVTIRPAGPDQPAAPAAWSSDLLDPTAVPADEEDYPEDEREPTFGRVYGRSGVRRGRAARPPA